MNMRAKYGSRQSDLLDEILETRGSLPSLASLAAWIDAPLSSAHRALAALERDGKVTVSNRGRTGRPLRIEPASHHTDL
jgi:DNA-binding IclR family transcriptional regulator